MPSVAESVASRPAIAQAPTRRFSATGLFLLVLVGVLLSQAAWVLVVPPFAGADEHEHAFKAAAVARGDWSPHHEASPLGWGEFLQVPRGLVEAAAPVCESLDYTTDDNCRPGPAGSGGLVRVASSAARYNPVFYAVVGSATRVLDGTAALYAMRALTALLCAVLVALSAVTMRRWACSPWPSVVLVLVVSPTMMYSTSIAAPNGVEMAAALLVWSALLGLVATPGHDRTWFLTLATVGAVPLVTVRALGPLWFALILLTIGLLLGWPAVRRVARLRAARVGALVVGTAVAAAVAWTLVAATNQPPAASAGATGTASVWPVLPGQAMLWVFQAVAAIPLRRNMAPAVVYAILLTAWWLLTVLALRAGRSRERLALAGIAAVSFALPVAATVLTYRSVGTAWQGRYGYPFAMGFLLVCGYVLDRTRTWARTPSSRIVWVTVLAAGAAQLVAQLGVLARERSGSPLTGTSQWPTPSAWLVILLAVLACLALGTALSRATTGEEARG